MCLDCLTQLTWLIDTHSVMSYTQMLQLAHKFSVSTLSIDKEVLTSIDGRAYVDVDRLKGVYVDRHCRQKGTNMLFSCLISNLVHMIYSLTNLRLNITGDSEFKYGEVFTDNSLLYDSYLNMFSKFFIESRRG